MDHPKPIRPIVTQYERSIETPRRDSRSSGQLMINKDDDFLTAVTHLDTSKPIGEDIIELYSSVGSKIMKQLGKSKDDTLDFHDFKRALGIMNLNVLESRVVALFNATVLGDAKRLTQTDLEIALMINDAYPAHVYFNSFYEIFASFDLDNCGRLNFEQFKECVLTMSIEEECDQNDIAYLAYVFQKTASTGRIDYPSFCKVWCNKLIRVNQVLSRRGLMAQNQSRGCLSSIHRIFTFIWRCLHRRDILQQLMTSPGHNVISNFGEKRTEIVELRLEIQKAKDKVSRSSKESVRKQHRKTVISASLRRKDMSLILRNEEGKTYAMMEGNRMMREKLLNDCESEKHNEDVIDRLKRQEQMNAEIEAIQRTGADRLMLQDKCLCEIPSALYCDQTSQLKLADVKVLDLSGNGLTKLPISNFFFHLISVRKLCLSRNQLKEIPDELFFLRQMEILLIQENKLTKLPSCIKNLTSLQILDLSNNILPLVQDNLCDLGNLRVLKLHSNRLTRLPEAIGNLKSLQSVDLSNNRLCILPDSFCLLGQLAIANLSNNRLSELPFQFGLLGELEDLDVSFNNIHELPDSMAGLEQLKIINTNQNDMREIGDYIEGLKSLTSFEGTHNKLEIISKHLGSLCNLRRLSILVNQVKTLPGELGLLRQLVHLNLHNNLIEKVPVEIGALNKLQSLDMSHNMISILPHEICLAQALIWIDLSNNTLHELPKHFGALNNVRMLKLANNKLMNLPETFKQLEKLEELDVSSNSMCEFNVDLCEGLVSLRVANFGSNRIKHLPKQISSMTTLEALDLSHNDLHSLPLELANSNIQIDLSHNPLDDLPFKFYSSLNKNISYKNPSGYSTKELNDFMAEEQTFYKPAVDEWNIKKTLYLEGNLNYNDFRNEVIWRSENIYGDPKRDDALFTRRLKQFYFDCKKYGNPPLYSYRDDLEEKAREDVATVLKNIRNERGNIARDLDLKRKSEENKIYYSNLQERCSGASGRFKQVQEKKASQSKHEIHKLLDEVTKRVNEKDTIDAEMIEKDKIAIARENEKFRSLFLNHQNKKRYLPIEVNACWKKKVEI